jgi:hypothetical protein
MRLIKNLLRPLALAVLLAGTVVATSSDALADKLHLKDGRVLDGVVVRETDTFVQFKVKIGGIESVQTFQKNEVDKIEKDSSTPTPGKSSESAAQPTGKPDAGKMAAEKAVAQAKRIDSGTNRVAVLNFGPPSNWQGEVDSTVGIQISVAAWREAIKLLDKDKVDTVIVRINSGGGMLAEMEPFQKLFQNVYKKKYRTVGWVESAISCAAMSPYPLEEFYFFPNGSLGACTAWSGALQNMEGPALELVIAQMERVSEWGGRSPAIMRSMQVQVPLSATIDKNTGEVTWFQDTSGEHILNRPGQIFTFTANDAVKFKFAKGIASTREELAKVMGLNEVEWAGEEASRFIDENMRTTDRTDKRWQLKYREFNLNLEMAAGATDRTDRGKFAGRALSALRELRQMFASNPNFGLMYGPNEEWFREQEEAIRRFLRD